MLKIYRDMQGQGFKELVSNIIETIPLARVYSINGTSKTREERSAAENCRTSNYFLASGGVYMSSNIGNRGNF